MVFLILFHLGFTSVMLGALKVIGFFWNAADQHRSCSILAHGVDSARYAVSCRVGVLCLVCECPNDSENCSRSLQQYSFRIFSVSSTQFRGSHHYFESLFQGFSHDFLQEARQHFKSKQISRNSGYDGDRGCRIIE